MKDINLIVKFLKDEPGGNFSSTIECKDIKHKNKIIDRFIRRGYKQVDYIPKIDNKISYPF